MRILTLTRGFYPAVEFGGPAISGYEVARRLAQRGHEVTVYTSNLRDRDTKLYPGTTERMVDGIRVIYINSVWQYHYAAIGPDIIGYCRREMAGFDIVNIYGLREFFTLVVTGYARRHGVPYVLQPLGNIPRYARSHGMKVVYDALFQRTILKNAACLVARSEIEAAQMRELGMTRDKIAIVPNGVVLEEYQAVSDGDGFRRRHAISSQEKLVLYVGRLAAIKSLDLLLAAFAQVNGNPRLVLVGPEVEPEYARVLKEGAARLGIADRVTFAGTLDHTEAVAAYNAADLFVLPSATETYGLSAAEAIASGTPVVVTKGCGLARTVHERVGFAVEHEVGALRGAIQRLLTDDALRAAMARRCGEVARTELSWDAAVDRLETVLARIANPPPTPALARLDTAATRLSLQALLDHTIDDLSTWPVEGDEFFLDYLRARVEDEPYVETLHYLAGRHSGGRLLDIGTGSGLISLGARSLGLKVQALDHPGRKWMETWLARYDVGFTGHDLTAMPMPLPDDSFDVVVFQDVVEHLPFSSRALFADIRRVLKPGGEVIVCTPNLSRLAARVKLLLGRTVHPPLRYFWDSEFPFPGHYREYTGKEVCQMLVWAGFDVHSLRFINRAAASRLWRRRARLRAEVPERAGTFRLLAQFAFDAARAINPRFAQTVWVTASKPTVPA